MVQTNIVYSVLFLCIVHLHIKPMMFILFVNIELLVAGERSRVRMYEMVGFYEPAMDIIDQRTDRSKGHNRLSTYSIHTGAIHTMVDVCWK